MKTTLLALPLAVALFGLSPVAHAVTVSSGGYTATDNAYSNFGWFNLHRGHPNNPVNWTDFDYKLPGGFIDQPGTRVLGNDDDAYTGPINLGFNFRFFNQAYNQVYITSNGLLTFGSSTASNSNTGLGGALPAAINAMPMIAVAWDDWTTTPYGTDGVYYSNSYNSCAGGPGCGVFIVEWHATKRYGSSNPDNVAFEAVLYEDSNRINLNYIWMDTGGYAAMGGSATAGIRDANADTNGRYLQWSSNQAVLSNGMTVQYTPNSPVPEPETYTMLLAGLGLLGFTLRHRKGAGR